MARSSRVTSVPRTAITSGSKLADFIVLPLPLFVLFRVAIHFVRHWYIYGALTLILLAQWTLLVALVIGTPLLYLVAVYLVNFQTVTGIGTLRGAYRLLYLRRRWPRALVAGDMLNGPHPPRPFRPTSLIMRPPRLTSGGGVGVEIILDTSGVNATANSIERHSRAIADVLRAAHVECLPLSPGRAKLLVSWRPAQGDLHHGGAGVDPTNVPTLLLDDVAFIIDVSTLVIGKSSSGKSNLVWNLINGLNQSQTPWRASIIDQKKVELTLLQNSLNVFRYTDTEQDVERAINEFHQLMMTTLEEMQANQLRSVDISERWPLHILIIDEFLLIPPHLRSTPDTKLGQILTVGRAAGFIIWANSQLSQVDALDRVRDLFPQRVCMATNSAQMTTAALGPNAEERGARCSEISRRGQGYIFTESHGGFRRFRCPFIPDDQIGVVAAGGVYTPESERNRKRSRRT